MKFEKVSYNQFMSEIYHPDDSLYEDIKLPKRATKQSAGYDIYTPVGFSLAPGESIAIPLGIRVKLDSDKVLLIVPRSGQGFKYKLQLDNTIGVIDADYYGSSNEGHIKLKITNDSREGKFFSAKVGDAIAQGIILQYFTVEDEEEITTVRDGGFGSTDK